MFRSSVVDYINIKNVIFSSNIIVGDSNKMEMDSRIIAIQRQQEIFYGYEAPFENFPIFTEVIPIPPITEELHFQRFNADPVIKVGTINVLGFSTSTVLQVGNTKDIYLESRIHHLRQLNPQSKEEALTTFHHEI